MNLLKKVEQEEQGSATIEFLGIVPLAFLVLAIVIQFVVGTNAVLMAHSAANEYASVYSVTENSTSAYNGARDIIDSTGDYLYMTNVSVSRTGRDFTANVNVRIRLMFIPKKLFGYSVPTIPFSTKASGRVIK